MSENLLRLIPTDPTWIPDAHRDAAITRTMHDLVPRADEISLARLDDVQFVDAGSNFEHVRCPVCHADVPMAWWVEQMDGAWATRFEELALHTPCCGAATSLNDLAYDWTQGFARFIIEARGPDRPALSASEQQRISDAVGYELRQIWTHR